jgi:hypothetical protein
MFHRTVMIESLEDRRLFSGTVVTASLGAIVSPAAVVKPAILGPSAVEGTYRGTATDGSHTLVLKLVVTSTRETLTITGAGTRALTLSASAFKKLRNGSFSFDGKVGSVTAKLSGKVTDSGLRISGSGTLSDSNGTASGTFSLKK